MAETLFEFIDWCILQIVRAVACVIVDVFGHRTARVIVPVLTLGKISVDPSVFTGWTYRNTPNGIVIGGFFAAFLGQLFWVAVAVAVGIGLRQG